ncbi:MAG: hypothetical protein L0Y44_06865 [Phycisphaerales bacterium]|nr:hypothetical protein [Phycisphaerales bacterium]MCI0630361.1 hypothetical protein [Phycisphaerales bacterium]MCI0677356.1 hypothetical protein [Phycisphaerales bacterium]
MKRLSIRALIMMMMLGAIVWPTVAMAQAAAPQPSLRNAPPVWLGLLIMGLLLAMVMAVSLLPSKRGHQD